MRSLLGEDLFGSLVAALLQIGVEEPVQAVVVTVAPRQSLALDPSQ